MNDRPKINVELTPTDKLLEILGWTFVLASWMLVIANYSTLPDNIPIHFNGAGKADGWGGKGTLFTLPAIATILFVGLTFLNKFPQIFNYPTKITADNALKEYTRATRLIRTLKLMVVIVFGFIAYQSIRSANGQSEGLGSWFLPLMLVLINLPLIFVLIKAFAKPR